MLIFSLFGVPALCQHRVLFWGMLGALVMRGIFIGAGAALLHRFHRPMYVFGAFLIFTAFRLGLSGETQIKPERDPLIRLFRKIMPITEQIEGERFFVRHAGVLMAMIVGLVGLAVPILPITPSLLLAAACSMRSSDRMYRWLTSSRLFGGFIRNYREQRGVSARAKIMAPVLLWSVIGYAALTAATAVWLRVLLATIAIGVTIHLLRLKTLRTREVRSELVDLRSSSASSGQALRVVDNLRVPTQQQSLRPISPTAASGIYSVSSSAIPNVTTADQFVG